jgi:predicted acyltransferase
MRQALLGGVMMTEETQVPEIQVPKRLGSLDAMRGFVMFLLLGGGEIGHAGILSALAAVFDHPVAKTLYQQLQYSQWGTPIHVKDLIRPLFIFVVGAAMPYAFGNRLSRGDSKRQVYWHVVQRAVILYLLGIIAGGHLLEFNWERFYLCNNVLQEIAVGYVVASLILLNCGVRGQLVALAALLLGYWALIMLVPVPGYGAGILTADVNLPRYVDDLVLGGLRPVKWNFTWVLSLPLASSCIVLLGAIAGQTLKSTKGPWAKLGWLTGAGAACLAASLVWSRWYPMIVNVTTGSWVLFVGAVGSGLLALFYLIIDVWGYRKWAFFFVVIGANSIAVYMAAHLFDFRHIGNVFVGGLAKWVGPWNNVVQTLAAFIVIWLILFWMYRKKTFIRV